MSSNAIYLCAVFIYCFEFNELMQFYIFVSSAHHPLRTGNGNELVSSFSKFMSSHMYTFSDVDETDFKNNVTSNISS